MAKGWKGQPVSGRQFNTLAQTGTKFAGKGVAIVQGKGSNLGDQKTIQSKARRKMITQKMAVSLVEVSDKYGAPEMKKAYWNTYHCQGKVITVGDRIHGKYCKNRFCTLCCANRKADIINRYLPVIQNWEQPQLVTLTVKAVPLAKLHPVMRSMLAEFRAIVETYRKRHQRGKGVKLVGIRSLESEFNPEKHSYNPHFHCIVASKEMAQILVKEWLRRSNKRWTSPKAQQISPIFNGLTAMIEVVKYGSKIFTEPDVQYKANSRSDAKIYVAALNNIFHAMRGLRIFERFGFDLPEGTRTDSSLTSVVQDYCEWQFHPEYFDWLNLENGNPLTCFQPTKELQRLLEQNVNSELE